MGVDNALWCCDCAVHIVMARNRSCLFLPDDLAELSCFLDHHAEHNLLFGGDDYWPRVPQSKPFKVSDDDFVRARTRYRFTIVNDGLTDLSRIELARKRVHRGI